MSRWSTEDFQGNENTTYDTIIMDTCHTFVHTHSMYNSKSELSGKLRTLVILCQCRFISCDKCTHSDGGVLIMGKLYL